MFPNAKFIYVVRDPTPVYSSTLKLWRTLYAVHGYQKPRFEHLEEEVIAGFAHFHERFEATKNLIPAGSLLTVKYEELVADPSALLKRTYASLDLGNFGAVASVIGDYLAKQRDYRPNHHELDEATRELLRERWRGYYDLHAY